MNAEVKQPSSLLLDPSDRATRRWLLNTTWPTQASTTW
jgi:hypothetical protein